MKSFQAILLLALPTYSLAHMEMNWPYPLKSKFDPTNRDSDRDYNQIAPLNADGSNYPCKGYQSSANPHVVANYRAGQQYNMSIVGGAPHNGGSCQLSLSYDNGQSFKVIKSMIGGCPVTQRYDFTIPPSAPASPKVLFAWTWFNLIGNREMYMDCAVVSIEGSNTIKRSSAKIRPRMLDNLPDIFLANIGLKSSCTTVEGQELVFPEPGSDVRYGAGVTFSSPRSNICKAGGKPVPLSSPTPSSTSPAAGSSSPSMTMSKASPTSSAAGQPTTLVTATGTPSRPSAPSSFSNSSSTASNPPRGSQTPTASGPKMSCTAGSPRCNSASTWSICSGTGDSYIYMGPVAPGTTCTDAGKLVRDPNLGSCPGEMVIKCSADGRAFMVCDQSRWVDMGSVAPGTKCVEGSIVAA
ncbi:MAG: hypothetical protein M1814_006712 [Vezdaea aestivalis]|nr:MAG: hypothetical protein M1814_006712 [Vezdaea aestivalis]